MGSPQTYNYAFMTNRQPYLCRFDSSQEFSECSLSDLCEFRGMSGFEYQPEEDNPNFMYNYFVDRDMLCWDENDIAYIAQTYYTGYSFSILLSYFSEKLGRSMFIKVVILPMLWVHHALEVLMPYDYKINLLTFFILGLTRIRIGNLIINCQEQSPSNKSGIASGFCYLLETMTIFLFCFFMKFVTKDAIAYTNVFGYVCIALGAFFMWFAAESPKQLVIQGN